jgi:glycosyltransferase involved in cell wall biosynthesis
MYNTNLIIISNPSRQHTPNIIQSFFLFNKECIWLTSFWYKPNKWYWRLFLHFIPSLKAQMLKRYSYFFSDIEIRFNSFGMFLFFFSRFLFNTEKRIFIEDRWHDLWVTSKINKLKPLIFIGYEKSCFRSFKIAKKIGVITILDLAQVHVNYIEKLRYKYDFFKKISGNERLFCRIKERKLQEYELANFILVLSSFARQTLIKQGVESSKIHLVNLGFDPCKFIPKINYSYIHGSPLRIIYTGIITKRKGVHLISNVANRLQHLSIEWVFVGSKDDAFDCINGLPNSRYIPYLQHDKLVKELHGSDIFVLPSYLDSWGMVVIEAMACGLPVIVSENTGAKDAVTDDSGFVIPIDDEDALMDKILYFYYNTAEIERMGKNAARVVQKYTWDNYYKQVNDFIDTIKV